MGNGDSPIEVVFGTTMNIKPSQIIKIVVVSVLVNEVLLIPPDSILHLILSHVVNHWLEAKDTHCHSNLCSNGLVPASLKVCKPALKRIFHLVPVFNFSEVHSDHYWQHSYIKDVTYHNHIAVDEFFCCVSLISNHCYQRPSYEIERVVDKEE